MKTYFFGWQNIRWFFKELALTLTGKESEFSQKKVLVYVIDISMLITSLVYMYQHRLTMTAGDHCMIVGLWLAKGTTNVIMTQGDKKIDSGDQDQNNKKDDKQP
jgi:hypothetical protein